MSAASDLQATINRFASVVGFTPLKVDGVIGPLTNVALMGALGWIRTDTSLALSMQLNNNLAQTQKSASGLTVYLGQAADELGLDPPMVAIMTQPKMSTSQAATVAVSPQSILKNQNALSAGLLGLGLPNWAVYGGGAALALALALLVIKKKSTLVSAA
jgi:hypothetical protein